MLITFTREKGETFDMSIAAGTSTYSTTVEMLTRLNESELLAIQSVIQAFLAEQNDEYVPLSEEEVLERIRLSAEHADAGIYQDADAVIDEVVAELGL